ncbi:MAG: hypothetical protein IKT07_00700 [Oscillospiraceae bacterium]|nr:hypothetical protein [Oscillospiraceae bacterium]
MDQGLYLTIRDSEQLERCLLTQKGEVRMAATTIRDELILFSELDFFPYAELLDILEIYGQAVHGSYDKPFEEVYPEYLQEMFLITEDLVDELSESDPLHGLLTKTHLKDVVPEDDGTAMYCIYARNALLDALAEVLHFQGDVLAALDEMAETGTTDLTALGPVNAMPLFSKGQEQFFFRSVSDYYHFLLMEFIKRGYRVVRCECCGRFFCPKTKKRTLYCDRILKDEKNCKHWGPILKHQLAAGQSKVIEEFDRARQKMYKRYERTRDVLRTKTDKSLTPARLWYWIESATAARDAYLRGELSQDDALAVIHADPQEE